MLLQRLSPTAALVSVGVAATAGGWLMWQLARPRPPAPQLSLADRQEKLRGAEEVFHRQFPDVPLISAVQAWSKLQQPDKFVLVDCRNKEEQEVSMVPGSRVLSKSAFEAQAASNQDVTAICMCTVGYRSSLYAQQLISRGRAAVNLAGGILSWTQEGLPLVDPSSQAPTNRVHTYSSDWAWQGDGYQPVAYKHSLLVLARDAVKDTVKGVLSWGASLGKAAGP